MIDRFGNKITVYWAPHELLWVEAALTLPYRQRQEAYHDIAAITTRSVDNVRAKAHQIKHKAKLDALRAAQTRRTVMRLPDSWKLPPSTLKPPTMAQLMGGR